MNKNLYVDFHVLQTVPPSCVNRDDTGSPKTAVYGGTLRARVSSQAWKRAMRLMFKDLFSSEWVGYRTRKMKDLVTDKICMEHPDIDKESAGKMASRILAVGDVKADESKKDVLFFVSSLQIDSLAKLAVEYENDTSEKKEKEKVFKSRVEHALKENPSVDILLFGRMAASNPSLNFDAAAQVAHSISTHTIANEYDYFTAVDDCTPEDDSGAGHIGTVEFNSSTLYRYATLNIRELAQTLQPDELKLAVKGFAESFVRSMPTGRQNPFANRTLPDMVYVTFREDQPVNLVGAFEKPVTSQGGYVGESKKAFISYAKEVYGNFVNMPQKAWIVGTEDGDFAVKINFAELLDEIGTGIGQYCAEGK